MVREIPNALLSNKTDNEALEQRKKLGREAWFKTILCVGFQLLDKNLQCYHESSSTILSQCFTKNHVTLGLGGKNDLLGDAFLPANVFLGQGVSSAIEDANRLREAFASGIVNTDVSTNKPKIVLKNMLKMRLSFNEVTLNPLETVCNPRDWGPKEVRYYFRIHGTISNPYEKKRERKIPWNQNVRQRNENH